jgi:hypothetical protein
MLPERDIHLRARQGPVPPVAPNLRAAARIVFLIVAVIPVGGASAADLWDAFLEAPTSESARALSSTLKVEECGWGASANDRVVPEPVRQPLFRLVESGNESAFVLAASIAPCLDGGDLEDFIGSGGQFLEKHPRRFLVYATKGELPERYVASMASGVDSEDLAGALRKLSRRRDLLSEVKDSQLAPAREAAIRAIDEFVRELRTAADELRPHPPSSNQQP